jgi:hypothetical protein
MGADGVDAPAPGWVPPELHGTATVAVPTAPVSLAVPVIVAVPQFVVLAMNVVEMKPGSVVPLVGFTEDPGTPDTVKSTVSPLSSLPLASVVVEGERAVGAADQAGDLLEVIENGDQRRSTIVTSQLPMANGHEPLGDSNIRRRHPRPSHHNAHRRQSSRLTFLRTPWRACWHHSTSSDGCCDDPLNPRRLRDPMNACPRPPAPGRIRPRLAQCTPPTFTIGGYSGDDMLTMLAPFRRQRPKVDRKPRTAVRFRPERVIAYSEMRSTASAAIQLEHAAMNRNLHAKAGYWLIVPMIAMGHAALPYE